MWIDPFNNSAGESLPKPRLFSYRFISVCLRNHSREGRYVQMHQKRIPCVCVQDAEKASRKKNWSGWSVRRKARFPWTLQEKNLGAALMFARVRTASGRRERRGDWNEPSPVRFPQRSMTVWRRRSENE